MTPAKLRLGLVGLGQFTYNVLYPAMRNLPVELAAACDVDPERLQRFAGFYNAPRTYTDYREMIAKEELDAVVCVIDAAAMMLNSNAWSTRTRPRRTRAP